MTNYLILQKINLKIYNIKVYTIDDKNAQFEKKDINFLDLGCGTGGHLDVLEINIVVLVLDLSMKMWKKQDCWLHQHTC